MKINNPFIFLTLTNGQPGPITSRDGLGKRHRVCELYEGNGRIKSQPISTTLLYFYIYLMYLISYNNAIQMREIDTVEKINGEDNYSCIAKADTIEEITEFLCKRTKDE